MDSVRVDDVSMLRTMDRTTGFYITYAVLAENPDGSGQSRPILRDRLKEIHHINCEKVNGEELARVIDAAVLVWGFERQLFQICTDTAGSAMNSVDCYNGIRARKGLPPVIHVFCVRPSVQRSGSPARPRHPRVGCDWHRAEALSNPGSRLFAKSKGRNSVVCSIDHCGSTGPPAEVATEEMAADNDEELDALMGG
jgi:hypothetical protein